MLPERSGGNVWRFHRSRKCIHAIWWKISVNWDSEYGCKNPGYDRKMRCRYYDELWIWSVSVKLEPISWFCLRSSGVYFKNRGSRWWLQEDPFHIPGVLPQNERGSETLEPAVCSITWCISGTDELWSAVHRWKRFHVRNLQWYRCTADTGFLCSRRCKRAGYRDTGVKDSRRQTDVLYHWSWCIWSAGLWAGYETVWCSICSDSG